MYNYSEIEKKWQKYWEANNSFIASNNSEKPKINNTVVVVGNDNTSDADLEDK